MSIHWGHLSSAKNEDNNDVINSSSSEVTEQCTEVFACDAIVKGDYSTWNFIRKDSFGDDMEYIYSVDGKTLVLTTIDSEGNKKVDDSAYSFYDMTRKQSRNGVQCG